MDFVEKARIRLENWIKHNDHHQEEYEMFAEQLEEAAKTESSDCVREMIEMTAKCTECLRKEFLMCEAHAFILKDNKEERVMESVDLVELEGDKIKLISIFGEQKTLKARLKLYDNTKRKIVFAPL